MTTDSGDGRGGPRPARRPFEFHPEDSIERSASGLETVDGDAVERRLTRAGQVRKAQILEKAAELFADRGYESTRVVDIMRAAGVSKGLFYWYFENKEALFRELVTSTRRRLRRAQSSAAGNEEDPMVRLALAIAASLGFVAANFNLYSLITRETLGDAFGGSAVDSASYYTAETARALARCQEAGTARDGDTVEMAAGINGAVSAHATLAARRGSDDATRAIAVECTEFCLRAIAADSSAVDRAMATVRDRMTDLVDGG